MSNDPQQIANKAWYFAQYLRDEDLPSRADEQKPPYHMPPIVPARFSGGMLGEFSEKVKR